MLARVRLNEGEYYRVMNLVDFSVYGGEFVCPSDDRLKVNEVPIDNATDTIMKLHPQIYTKFRDFAHTCGEKTESGLIAQDIWYNIPELKHIVSPPLDPSGNRVTPLPLPEGVDTTNDIQNDPDYNNLGWTTDSLANLDYIQLIPYLIKSNQEQQLLINNLTERVNALESAGN